MSPTLKNPSPKFTIKQLLYQSTRNIIKQEPKSIVEPKTVNEQPKPERAIIEPVSTEWQQNKINKLDIVITCVNYSDFLIVSLTENVKIINAKNITVVTDSNDILTQKICQIFGVNCVVTDRFYEDGAVFNKGKGINEGIKSIKNPEWILITDADIVFPQNMLDILNKKSLNKNKLYAATRYLCYTYQTFLDYKEGKISIKELNGVHRCPPVGYFQLFNYNHTNLKDKNIIYPEISNNASWSDLLFADKFPQKECIQEIELIHLGEDSKNWNGRKTDRFIDDETFNILMINQESIPFVPSIRKIKSKPKLAVITSLFNPANYSNLLSNYDRFKQFIEESGVDLFTAEVAFEGQDFHTEESKFNLHIRGTSNNIMWQKERLLNILLDYVPNEYNNIAWIDADVIFDNPNWVAETNEKLQTFKLLQLFETANFYDENNQIYLSYNGIVKVLHKTKQKEIISFDPYSGGGTPGLAWAIRRESIDKIKFIDHYIVGGGDTFMVLASIGRVNNHFVYQQMTNNFYSYTLPFLKLFYQEIQNSVFYISGNAYHLYHGTAKNRKYNERPQYLIDSDFDPLNDIKLDTNKLWTWNSNKPKLHEKIRNYFYERNEDDNLGRLNDYFDGIFCINLDRRVDKWERMQKKFKKYNITVERIQAFDGNWGNIKNEWASIRQHLQNKYGKQMLEPSKYGLLENEFAYGCLLSNIFVIKIAKQRKLKNILIFDDDIIFHKNFNSEIKKIANFKNWKLLYLGASQFDWNNIQFKDNYYYAKHTLGSFAYAIDNSIYDEVLELALRYEKSFDNCLANFNGNDIQSKYPNDCYVLYPNLVIANVQDSDIRQKRDQNEHAMKVKWDLSLYDFND